MSFLLVAGPAAAQQAAAERPAALAVRIMDGAGAPLGGVNIEIAGVAGIATDSAGRALLQGITPGRQLLRITRYGFHTEALLVDFDAGVTAELEARLRPGMTVLQHTPVLVDARMAPGVLMRGFEQRRRSGIGTFIDRQELSRLDPMDDLAFALRRLRGFSVRPTGGGDFEVVSARDRDCPAQLLIDGAPTGIEVVRGLTLHDIEAIEAYPMQATTPPQFLRTATSGTCGSVVLWTRPGRRR